MKGGDHLTIKLNKRAFEHAKRLIEKGGYVFDEKDCGASINRLHKKRMSILKSIILMNMGNGIWE